MEEALRAWVREFAKTPYIYPVSIAVAAAVYYLVITYAANVCLINLVTPLILLGLLWMFKVKSIKRLFIIGLIAVVVLSFVWLGAYTQFYGGIQPQTAVSEDGHTLADGIVTPFKGTGSYNFTLTVHLRNSSGTPIYFEYVNVFIQSANFPSQSVLNESMTLLRNDTANLTQLYYFDAQLPSINAYAFLAGYTNQSYEIAGHWSLGRVSLIQGPYPASTGTLVGALIPFSFFQTLSQVLLPYILIIGMIWWTRRTRKMREEQIEKWRKEEAQKEAAQPKSKPKQKVPSLATAMGTDKGETFVCSECGADVPAEATVCPNCGEKFD